MEKRRFDLKRFISGIAFGVAVIAAVLFLNVRGFFFAAVVLIALSVYEIYGIFDMQRYSFFILPEILSVSTAFALIFLTPGIMPFIVFFSCFLIFVKNVLFFGKDAGKSIFIDVFSVFYAGVFIAFVPKILQLSGGKPLLILLLIIIWASDIFAYYGGRHFGRHKLFPSLSPGKTVEGALAGVAGAFLTALVFRIFSDDCQRFAFTSFAVLSLSAIFAGIFGDLTESLLKRIGGKKDSGAIIPGHGGILDRIDSLVLAAPFFYYIAAFYLR